MQYTEAKQRAAKAWEDITKNDAPILLIKVHLLKLWLILLFKKFGLKATRLIDDVFNTNLTNYFAAKELKAALHKLGKLAQIRDFGYKLQALPFDRIRSKADIDELIAEAQTNSSKFLLRVKEEVSGTPYESLINELDTFIKSVDPKYLKSGLFGKIVRSMVGVVGFYLVNHQDAKDEDILKYARIGYHYGRTYLFDDILDKSKEPRDGFISKVVAQLSGTNIDIPLEVTEELVIESLDYLKENCKEWDQISATYLTLAQATLSDKKLFDKTYTEKEVYESVIIKSACTRILSALMGDFLMTEKFLQNSFTAGMANQLIDDFRDYKDDYATKNFTPFTYYYRGAGNKHTHPLNNYFKAIAYSSAHSEIEGALELWLMRFSHGIRIAQLNGSLRLMLETKKDNLGYLIQGIGHCDEVIIDIEARMAKRASAIALARVGLPSTVVGH